MQSEQTWIAFGDIHEDLSRLDAIPLLAEASGIIVTGDMTNAGGIGTAERVLEAVVARNPRIYAQIGNMDRGEVTDWLRDKGWNMHAEVVELAEGAFLVGAGASTATPFGTPSEFPESYFAALLEDARHRLNQLGARHVLLVSHNPPHGTACDRVGGNTHVGSMAVRRFIEAVQPDVCLCGHIHESRGEDRIGRTVVVNPGNLRAGGYVVVRLGENGFSAKLEVLPAE